MRRSIFNIQKYVHINTEHTDALSVVPEHSHRYNMGEYTYSTAYIYETLNPERNFARNISSLVHEVH